MSNEDVIQLSKVKNLLLVIGSLAFVVLGFFFLSADPAYIESQRKFNSPALIYSIGAISVIFFGFCFIAGIKKLFDTSPGLVINSEGILDNSSGVSGGLIPWSEVVGIGEYQVQGQKFVSIKVKDPEKYAENGNFLKRMANRANIKMCGTPINISANSLKISYEDLVELIAKHFKNSMSNA